MELRTSLLQGRGTSFWQVWIVRRGFAAAGRVSREDLHTLDSKSKSMKRGGSSDYFDDETRGRSSKAQRSEVWVWGNQMDSISKQIEKLRDERKALSIAWATEKNKEKEEALNGAIDKLDEEIQAKEAELKNVTKEYKEATQAMKIDEIGGVILTENPAGGDYAKALVEAEKREAGDAKISKFLPMVLLTVCTDEAKSMKDKRIKGILVFGRRCFIQVVKEFRRIRKEYIDGATLRFCILAGQSGIGKSLAFSQIYMREAFIQGEKVAFYSVREATIYLFRTEGGKYTCQQAEVNDQGFWKTKAWKTFDDRSAHLIIDPAPSQGHKYFQVHLVEAFVVYLTSPNSELRSFENVIRGVRRRRLFVPTLAIEESKAGIKRTDYIHFGDLKLSSRIFSVQPSTTEETLLYKKNLKNFTGLDGEKWFFAKIYKGCKLLARRLPKKLADAEKRKGNGDWEDKIHEFPAHSTLKTFSNGVKGQIDKCRAHIKKIAEDQKAELVVCPTNYPAIDGATNCRTLYQVTISSKKSVGKAYVDELISFGASKAEKARVFFLVPEKIVESFSISFAKDSKDDALKLAEFWVVGINLIEMIEDAQKKKSKITTS
eukprot:jgi/Bigna1/67545/fgenesh1_pg.4_\